MLFTRMSTPFDPKSFSNDPYVQRVEKPWGYEIHWTPSNLPYMGKVLHINEGKRLSLQRHELAGITDCDVVEASTPEIGITERLEDDYKRPDETEDMRKLKDRGWNNNS